MAKPRQRPSSRYSLRALALLGQMIRAGRLERKMTLQEMASRIGISRGLLQRVEKGEPGSAIGAVFEAAAIVGIPLFESTGEGLEAHRAATSEKLRLLPSSARRPKRVIHDDF